MIKEIKMPNLGTTTNEMKVVRWHKKENDQIKRGEVLFEVETDKAVMEVESYLSGYLKKIEVDEAGLVTTGAIVAYIGNEDDVFEHKVQTLAVEEKANERIDTNFIENKTNSVRISPMVKKIADKLKVNYTTIQGTGPNGMITKDDVEKAAENVDSNDNINIEKFDRIAKATAKAMTLSKTTIPHVYFTVEVNTTSMIQLRKASGKTVSYNTMIIKAVADCIKKYPYLASKYSDEGRIMTDKINIGLAVARGNDLLVPVIDDVGNADDYEVIEAKVKAQVAKVIDDKLQQSDISGGVFTITNLGGYGIDSFIAVINPPEAAILAVGCITQKVVVADDKMNIQPMMKVTLSVDHRVVNGAYAAVFLKTLKTTLEGVGN